MKTLFIEHRDVFSQFINKLEEYVFVMKVNNGSVYYEFLNKAAEKHLRDRYNINKNLIGKEIREVLGSGSDEILENYLEVVRKKEEIVYNYEYNKVLELSTLSPIFDNEGNVQYIMCITKDISSKVFFKENEEKYKLIVENSKDFIQILDLDGEILFVSRSHEKFLGYKKSILTNRHITKIVEGSNRDGFIKNIKEIRNTENIIFESIFKDYYGNDIPVEVNMIKLNHEYDKEFVLIVASDISSRKEFEDNIKKMAYYDHLTGLGNRRKLSIDFEKSINKADCNNKIGLLYIDCDKFKLINDNYGHDIGDDYLIELSERLRENVIDSKFIYRIGGDEFVILITDINDEKDIIKIKDEIYESVVGECDLNGNKLIISISIGYSIIECNNKSLKDVIREADLKMYRDKSKGI